MATFRRIIADFGSVGESIVPSANVTYDLGTANNSWKDLFLSGNTISIAGATIGTDSTTGAITLIPKATVANPSPKATIVTATGVTSVNTTNGSVSSNVIASASVSGGASVTVYATVAELPLSENQAGDQAYVSETNRLYLWNGSGWYNIALINTAPSITSGSDAAYSFATDGTPIVITLVAADPEDVPIAWSYAVTTGTLGNTATVSQTNNVFTITPSTNTENAGQFSITFTASDGVNLATAVSSFTLSFGVADQYYNSTSLLVKSGSTAGLNNNTFVDESTNGFTVTPAGDVYQGSLSPYSPAGWSNYFDGSTDYLDIPGDAAAFGTSDYTVEGWHYYTGAAATNTRFLIDCRFGGGSNLLLFFENAIYKLYIGGHVANGGTLVKDAWQHFALVRSSGSTKLYVNGTSVFTWADSTNYASTQIRLGRDVNNNDSLSWVGYMSDIRIVKGSAVYTSNFTPPTEPLTAIAGTSLLTCQSNRFIDNSTNNFTITKTGDTKAVPFSPYLPSEKYDPTVHGGSAYFDGTGDSLSAASNTAFAMYSGTFTFECFLYINALPGSVAGIFDTGSSVNPNRLSVVLYSSGKIYLDSNANLLISDAILSVGQWYHIAIVREGTGSGQTKLYVNGVLNKSSTVSTDFSNSNCKIGQTIDNLGLNGYLSNLRLVKGTAVYTSNFTPPTEPLTAISGTSLLLNMNNAGIYDEISKNNIKMVGNSTTSTTQTKYNDTSVYFDGAGDRLIVPSSPNFDFTGNFTIEMWINFANVTSTWEAIISRAYGVAGGWRLYKSDGNNQLTWYSNTTPVVTTPGSTLANNTWSHIAVVRNNNTVTIYIDGVNRGSATNTTSYTPGNYALEIGEGVVTSAYPFEGYMQDLRITKGVARYTANFTPPTASLGFYNAE